MAARFLIMRRDGFTLVEIMFALVLLMVVVLGMMTSTGGFIHTVAKSDIEVIALQMADDRVQMVLMNPNYAAIDTAYAGTESSFPGLTGFTRVTQISHIGGGGMPTDHKRLFVVVDGPGLDQPIKRSATIAAP